ncbi:MAG: hypothetical protein DWQ34_03305 [Planctomycetota bacterium]|nr:MAG: hypothetical protein DWQ34_03305 [Planctomycetota bacterium]
MSQRRMMIVIVAACALLATVEVPLTLRRPLTADCYIFDLEWRTMMRGGMLYRDIFQTNPPGTLWIHAAVRTLLGTSSEALRAVDLVLMGFVIGSLAVWTRRLGRNRLTAWVLALLLIWFYGSQSIWCQCQRDGWMLSFAMLAMEVRWRRGGSKIQSRLRWHLLCFVEGALWGCAVWIKPFVIVPGAAVWLADRRSAETARSQCADFPGLLAGGLVTGALGLVWMIGEGVWPHFLEVNREWNSDYFASRQASWGVLLALAIHFGPWSLLHLLAVCVMWLWWRGRTDEAAGVRRAQALLAALYVGWTAQALLLQHGHAYVHLPPLMIAAAIVAGAPQLTAARLWRPVFAVWVLGVLWMSPLARFEHLPLWRRCVTGPVTPETRDRLRGPLDRIYPGAPDLTQLDAVAEFLRLGGVGDGEVCCHSYSTMKLYWELDIEPPCRFICPRIYANRFFVHRRDDIAALLEESPQRYVVSDLVLDGFSEREANAVGPGGPLSPPPTYDAGELDGTYPWSHPVVFRAGRYLVHEVRGGMGEFTSRRPRRREAVK